MSVETFSPTDTIRITPEASKHFSQQLERSGAHGIRISLKKSGCSGYMYTLDEVDEPTDSDIKMTLENGVVVCFDSAQAFALQGTEIDYTKEGLNYRLLIEHPNAVNACGCGESFNLDLKQA